MQFFDESVAGNIRVALRGDLTLEDRTTFRQVLNLISDTTQSVEISLKDISHIDSAGAGLLMLARDHSRKAKAEFSLTDPPSHLQPLIQHLA